MSPPCGHRSDSFDGFAADERLSFRFPVPQKWMPVSLQRVGLGKSVAGEVVVLPFPQTCNQGSAA